MHTPQLRALAAAALLSAAHAQYIIDNLSFGHKDPISPNLRAVPHFAATSDGYTPEILSDRVILTPAWPGQKRSALWSEDALHRAGDWTAALQFRASGQERGGGNLQLWYTKESQKNEAPSSLYTAPKFDGLVLVVDQYEGRGGSVRGFLNDGTIDFRAAQDPDMLAFGTCNYPYRNLGRLSELKVHHTVGVLEVTVDGLPCFQTDKVKLPEGYHFGVSASSAENPDSFEVFKFVVESKNAYKQEPVVQNDNQQQQQQQRQQQQQQQLQQQQQKQNRNRAPAADNTLADTLASSIRSQSDQFADLHDRLQTLSHRVSEIHDLLARLDADSSKRFNDLMHRFVPIEDRSAAIIRTVEKVERSNMEIQRDLESKDFKDMLTAVHNAIQDNHEALSSSMPLAMAHIVGKERPSMTKYLFIAVVIQIMVMGAYIVYKKRKNQPKKYL